MKSENTGQGTYTSVGSAPFVEGPDLAMVEVEGSNYAVCSANPAFCRLVRKESGQILGSPFSAFVAQGEKLTGEISSIVERRQREVASGNEVDTQSGSWLSVLWPNPEAGSPEKVVVHVRKMDHFRANITAMNEALLVSGLREHEQRTATEKLNVGLVTEMASHVLAESLLKEAHIRLKSAHEIADGANKAKDLFIAALSHELRTPLTPVLVAASLLSEDRTLTATVRAQLRMIERNVILEARLIDDLLDITRITHGKLRLLPVACDAHSLIGLALEMVRPEAEQKEIVIERHFDSSHGGLFADPARFQQVIWNLLRNAVKFTPRGGQISIRTQDDLTSAQGSWLKIEVTDNGVGIEADLIEKIFEPFDQGSLAGDHRFGGIGLGLAIARSVVALHGGTIRAFSAGSGRGTTLSVRFPATKAPPPSGLSAPGTSFATPLLPVSSPPPGPTYRLLFVEDHPATLDAFCALLAHDGHHVVTATSVAQALSAAAQDTFDFVLSDLGLPDGSGIEMMTILRDKYGLRGIAMSGYGMEEDIKGSRQAGFIAHLIKPVSPNELRRTIASLRAV